MEMGKNVRMSVLLMAALVMVAAMATPTMAIRGNIPLQQALRQRGIPAIRPEGAMIGQQLAKIMLGTVAAAEKKEKNALQYCIPQGGLCGPEFDEIPCCEPCDCTDDIYGFCVICDVI